MGLLVRSLQRLNQNLSIFEQPMLNFDVAQLNIKLFCKKSPNNLLLGKGGFQRQVLFLNIL